MGAIYASRSRRCGYYVNECRSAGKPLTGMCAAAVNVYMPKDRVTNAHQGYGFVEFKGEEDADYVSGAGPASGRGQGPSAGAASWGGGQEVVCAGPAPPGEPVWTSARVFRLYACCMTSQHVVRVREDRSTVLAHLCDTLDSSAAARALRAASRPVAPPPPAAASDPAPRTTLWLRRLWLLRLCTVCCGGSGCSYLLSSLFKPFPRPCPTCFISTGYQGAEHGKGVRQGHPCEQGQSGQAAGGRGREPVYRQPGSGRGREGEGAEQG